MVRSLWMGPVVVALAVTGLAVSRTRSDGDAIQGTPRSPCKKRRKLHWNAEVLRPWRMPDGHKSLLVQAWSPANSSPSPKPRTLPRAPRRSQPRIITGAPHDQPPTGTPEIANNALILGNPVGRQIPVHALPPITVARTEPLQPITPTPSTVAKQGPYVYTPVPAYVKPTVPVVTPPKPPEVKPPVAVTTTPKPLESQTAGCRRDAVETTGRQTAGCRGATTETTRKQTVRRDENPCRRCPPCHQLHRRPANRSP